MRRKLLRYFLFGLGFLIVLGVVLLASLELTSKPAFCSTCHYMEPYVQGWKTSSHNDVTCTDCHFPPGFKSKLRGKFTALSMVANYITGVYKKSKPWAEISDASCLRSGCHEERLLSGKVLFMEKVIFDHEPHLTKLRRGKKLRCTSCHSQIIQGEHITVTESSCFLCHFKDEPVNSTMNACTKCHTAPMASEDHDIKYDHQFIVDQNIDCKKCHGQMQVGDGAVPTERCNSCHADVGVMDKYDDPDFIHQNHVTDHKVECQNCHLTIQHKSVSRSENIVPECQSCHENTHQVQLSLFTGTGGKNIPNHPNPMFQGGLNCQACHIFHQVKENDPMFEDIYRASSASCDQCHGSGYNRILDQWQSLMADKITRMDSLYNRVRNFVVNMDEKSGEKESAHMILEEAHYNFMMVKNGNVVHNVTYSDELLQSAYHALSSIILMINAPIPLPEYSAYGDSHIPTECNNCHYGIEDISPDVYDMKFSHSIHIKGNGQSCYDCHSNKKKHGELIKSRKDCQSCHHTLETFDCTHCHSEQSQVYDGTAFAPGTVLADVMYEAGIECRNCHENDDEVITRDVVENCTNCHDDRYENTLNRWQNNVRELILVIEPKLNALKNTKDKVGNPVVPQDVFDRFALIQKDKSMGAHNYELISGELKKIRLLVQQSGK